MPPSEDVVYLETDDVPSFFADIFEITDRQAAAQLRDRNGLESALARPAHHASNADADVALQAAVLGHSITERQFFIDGNKRLAATAVVAFLRFNNLDLSCSKTQLADWIIGLCAGNTAEEVAAQPRPYLISRPLQ